MKNEVFWHQDEQSTLTSSVTGIAFQGHQKSLEFDELSKYLMKHSKSQAAKFIMPLWISKQHCESSSNNYEIGSGCVPCVKMGPMLKWSRKDDDVLEK